MKRLRQKLAVAWRGECIVEDCHNESIGYPWIECEMHWDQRIEGRRAEIRKEEFERQVEIQVEAMRRFKEEETDRLIERINAE